MEEREERGAAEAGTPEARIAELQAENSDLRAQLAGAEETVRAIRRGEVDAFVVESKQGERIYSLRSAEHAYHAFVEHMREGAATTADDGTVLYVNRRLSDMIGLPSDKLVGTNFLDQVAPEDTYVAEALLQRGRGRESGGDLSLVGRRGNRVPVHLALFPIDLEGVVAVCVLVMDLTEINRYRYDVDQLVEARTSELQRSSAELREATEAKNLLIARLGDELARLDAELVAAIAPLPPEEQGGRLKQALMKLNVLMRDVAILGDIESGNANVQISKVQLPVLSTDAMNELRPMAEERGLELVLDTPPAETVQFMADAGKLRQLLVSLLQSAITHSRGGVIRVHVEVTPDLMARIVVTQPGEPADQEDLSALLSGRFERELLDRVDAHVDALSLWVASRLAHFLGGSLNGVSGDGVMTFAFSLPV